MYLHTSSCLELGSRLPDTQQPQTCSKLALKFSNTLILLAYNVCTCSKFAVKITDRLHRNPNLSELYKRKHPICCQHRPTHTNTPFLLFFSPKQSQPLPPHSSISARSSTHLPRAPHPSTPLSTPQARSYLQIHRASFRYLEALRHA